MKRKVLIRPEAESDIAGVYRWYEGRRNGLGSDFLLCLEEGLAKVQRSPELYPLVHNNLRRLLIRRFPYGIFYMLEPDSIVVVAVFHGRRNPKALTSRG